MLFDDAYDLVRSCKFDLYVNLSDNKNRMGRLSAACSLILKYVERRAMWRRFPAACSFENFQKNHGFEHGFEQLSEAIE